MRETRNTRSRWKEILHNPQFQEQVHLVYYILHWFYLSGGMWGEQSWKSRHIAPTHPSLLGLGGLFLVLFGVSIQSVVIVTILCP